MLDDKSFMKFAEEIRRHLNFDMSGYKIERMKRRVDLLMKRYGFDDYDSYLKLLKEDPSKEKEFFDRITINVSEFFRNPDRWEKFKSFVSSEMKKSSIAKIWSAGCATGEEPYTVGIILEELNAPAGFNVLATDIDNDALDIAKDGIYESKSLINVDKSLLAKYFTQIDGSHWKISDRVKRRVNFKRHNMLSDPFDRDFYAIICRNVVIYFEADIKDKLYANFAKSLKSGGILFIGGTERIFNAFQIGLQPIEPFFYRKV
ncbi:CheR family methyltransferase [Athalassotoga saccharophila]|uniref:CheR family methyltransferase n=1 Tax=Athalassotoga saccharophila TaxID=1441386 RepID=UPI0018D7E67C|nr:protein-glutamate O-methyltransferase CheR [Athalassotoga saccharophila]BBJ28841.1 chemotaxis protein methyltransferase [Athalassotoga saccharophila]